MFLHDYRLVCELYTVGTLTLTQTERIRRAKIVRTENPGYWLVMYMYGYRCETYDFLTSKPTFDNNSKAFVQYKIHNRIHKIIHINQ